MLPKSGKLNARYSRESGTYPPTDASSRDQHEPVFANTQCCGEDMESKTGSGGDGTPSSLGKDQAQAISWRSTYVVMDYKLERGLPRITNSYTFDGSLRLTFPQLVEFGHSRGDILEQRKKCVCDSIHGLSCIAEESMLAASPSSLTGLSR